MAFNQINLLNTFRVFPIEPIIKLVVWFKVDNDNEDDWSKQILIFKIIL